MEPCQSTVFFRRSVTQNQVHHIKGIKSIEVVEQKTRNSVEHITDMVMSELKSRNTTNNGSVDHLAGWFDRGREMAGYDRKNVSKEDLKKQVLKLEKDVHELEQANKKQESFVLNFR